MIIGDESGKSYDLRHFADAKNNLSEIIHDFDKYRYQVEVKKEALKQAPGIFEKSFNSFFAFINLVIEIKNQFIDSIKSQFKLAIEFKNKQLSTLSNFGLKLTHQLEEIFLSFTNFRKNYRDKSFEASSKSVELLTNTVSNTSYIYSQTITSVKQVVPQSPQVLLRAAAIFGLVTALILPVNSIVAFAEETPTEVVSTETPVESTPTSEPTDSPSPEPSASEAIEVGSEVIVEETPVTDLSPGVEPSPEVTESASPTPSPTVSIPLVVVNAPTNLNFTPVVEGIKLTWDKTDSEIDKYIVIIEPDNRQIDVSKDANELLIADLDRKATYSFSIWAVFGEVNSEVTGPVTVDLSTVKFPRPPMNAEVGGLIVKFEDQELSSQDLTNIADTTQLQPVSLEVSSEIATDTHLVEFNQPVDVNTANEIADALEANNSVEYAELDFAFITASETKTSESFVPNDPLYATKQWSLWGNFGVGIADGPTGLAKAYQNSTGLGSVVAVIDTGFTNHPDLEGQFVSGYDFVSNNEMLSGIREENGNPVPYDGDYIDQATYGPIGWDDNPQDPGDWNSTRSSSWHGTYIAGLIAAKTNNGIGIAGIAPDAKIQPIRAFSWRGGLLSDVIASITWASGGTVENVPANQTPAKVINLSFSVEAPCTPSLQLAIDEAINRGSVVVAAAGNNNQDAANFAPGNCQNVITVGAINSDGEKAAYSNFGVTVDISAPGGELDGQAIYSTSNEGSTTSTNPAYVVRQGTSIATAQVSAAIAKLAQTYPTENAVQLKSRILSEESTKPFQTGKCLTDKNCGIGYLFFEPASTSISYNFNTTGDLTTNFNGYVSSGSASQANSGGISNTGAINAPGSADAVFTTKSSYSLGPVGSTYTFSSYLQSIGNSGYSGVGFTSSSSPSASNASGSPFRPNDAIGISVHGGGFVFHNGATDVHGSWDADNAGITSITKSTSVPDLLNNGSPVDWYKIVFKITRDSNTTFDTRVEVYPSDADGTLRNGGAASAVFEYRNITNSTITNAPSIHSYINFSGDRVRYFDDYSVTLSGGATVIAAGSPVVLTSSVLDASGVVNVSGEVTSDGGSTVTERGFVYSNSTSPTTANTKITLGNGTGTFTGNSGTLSSGTYYFRAFATNSNGTSYGSENTVIITSATYSRDCIANDPTPGGSGADDRDTRTLGISTGETITVYVANCTWYYSANNVSPLGSGVSASPNVTFTVTGPGTINVYTPGRYGFEWTFLNQLSTPSAPTVAATSGVLKSIDVSWSAVTNASSYTLKIYNLAGDSLLKTITGLSGTSKTITTSDYSSLADATSYRISITAIGNGTSYSDSSESIKSSVTTNSEPPSITSISPSSGSVAGGQTITISGTAFSNVNSVMIGGNAATFTVNSATEIQVTTPAGTAGAKDVVVADLTNSDTEANGFTYTRPLNNEKLRFGTGFENSVNSKGLLQQPFYKSGSNWYKLTYSSYPLNFAVATGTGGSNWTSGTVFDFDSLPGNSLTDQVINYDSYVSASGKTYGTITSVGKATINGSQFEFTNIYQLGLNDSYIKITSKIKNLSASPVSNVSMWTGTRDDWVGSTDSPTKTKGTLRSGSFVATTDQSTLADALEIKSGSEGVLFYSTSSGVNMVLHPTLGFSNPVNRNPLISPLSISGDDSYAMYVPVGNLNANQEFSFNWYYAAGQLADLNTIATEVASAEPIPSPTPTITSGGGGGGSTLPTPTPSPTITSTTNRTPTPRPTNLINNPLAIPTPTPTPSLIPGTINRPEPLVPRIIDSLINALRPRIVDLTTSPTPQATTNSTAQPQSFTNQQALQLAQPTEDKKVVELPSLVLVDNVYQPSKVVIVDNTTAQIVTPGGGVLNVAAKDGEERIPVDNEGRVQMVRNNNVETQGQGLAPNTEFAVYLFSEPKLLGVGKTDSQGNFYASFPVEDELPIGDHTLQVNGLLPDGKTASVSMPVVIVDSVETAKNQAMPKTILVSENPVEKALRALYWILIVLAAMVFLIAVANRKRFFALFRRRDDDEEPQTI